MTLTLNARRSGPSGRKNTTKPKKPRSILEEKLALQIQAAKIVAPVREYRFAALASGGVGDGVRHRLKLAGMKDWKFDFCWPGLNLAIEIEGGGWTGGGHTRGKGFASDLEKYRCALLLGWKIFRCDGDMVRNGIALKTIETLVQRNQEVSTSD